MNNSNYFFENPEAFYLLLLLPLYILYLVFIQRKKQPKVKHSATTFMGSKGHLLNFLPYLSPLLKMSAFALLVIALARPRGVDESVETISKEGIDIVLTMDVSTSMKALDFKPNRLEASKEIAIDFVDGRKNDRIGLVIYAAESFTQCPITTDYKIVKNLIKDIDFGLLEDGTAIGMGLATAVSRLKDSKAESKVIILLTDGENTAGLISPMTAAEMAAKFGIKVYTIAVGRKGEVPYPYNHPFLGRQIQKINSKVDVKLLKNIATTTSGKFFRAKNNKKLKEIYKEIEKLEKTEVQELKYKNYTEFYRKYVTIALFLLVFDRLLTYVFLKSIAKC
ncbi:MAG: VWA domain-containing protein [Flavobacteriales bacterium]|jgi:Ca-activated chloride channel family protein|nr:VWA domain-containing protein [Flavobacteriales bacterium]